MSSGLVREIKGNLYVVIKDDNGSITTRSVKKELELTRKPTRREAEKLLAKKLMELEETGIAFDSSIKLSKFLEEWLESRKDELADTTLKQYQENFERHVYNSSIGKLPLKKINKAVMQKYVNTLKEKTGARQVKYIISTLHAAFKTAIAWELISRNPAENLSLPKYNAKEKTFWTVEQLKYYMDNCKKDVYYILIILLITTGMRRGEALALDWSDIDFNTQAISITKSLTDERQIKEPKNKSSIRKISVPESTLELLKQHRKNQLQWYMARCIRPENNAVFTSLDGTYFFPRNVLRHFKDECKRLNLPETNLHQLRHLHVSILVSQNVDLIDVQHRVGHAKLSTTTDIYSHLIQTTEKRTSEKIEDFMQSL